MVICVFSGATGSVLQGFKMVIVIINKLVLCDTLVLPYIFSRKIDTIHLQHEEQHIQLKIISAEEHCDDPGRVHIYFSSASKTSYEYKSQTSNRIVYLFRLPSRK